MAELSVARSESPRARSATLAALGQVAEGMSFWAVLSGIVLIAIALRLPGLGDRSLWPDEAYSAWFSALPLHELWTDAPRYETHPPIYYTLLKGWVMLFGDSEAALRSLSLIASVATVLLASVSGKILRLGIRGDRVALLAALLLAINPASIVYSQEARPYALQTLVTTAAILSALSLLGAFRAAPETARLRAVAVPTCWLALSAAAMLWLHNTSVFIAFGLWAGLGAAILAGPREGRVPGLMAAFVAGLLALAIWSPFLPMLLEQGRSVTATAFWVKAKMRDLWSGWILVTGGTQLLLPVLCSTILGLVAVRRLSLPAAVLVACVLVLPLAGLLAIHFTVRPIFIDRLFVWAAPLVMGLAALGLLHGPVAGLVRLALAVLVIGISLTITGTRPSEEDWRWLVTTIAKEAQPGDLLVAFPTEIDPAIGYYARRYPSLPQTVYVPGPFPYREPGRIYIGNLGAPMVAPEDAVRLRPALAEAGRIWLVSRRGDLYDPGGVIRQAVAEGRRPTVGLAAGPITIELFE